MVIDLPLYRRGKVRDSYRIDDHHLLMVTSDRVSAFDFVFEQSLPGKGEILCQMSRFWFQKLTPFIPVHFTDIPISKFLPLAQASALQNRACIVKRLQPILIEAVVRAYLVGSAWDEYQEQGTVAGSRLPQGLHYGQKLPELLFTPAIKAASGQHDENISFASMALTMTHDLAEKIRTVALKIFQFASEYAASREILIVDSKFEFGLDEKQQLCLIDEVFTPDSSRFWKRAAYEEAQLRNKTPAHYDKQVLRDWLLNLGWNKKPPLPALSDEIMQLMLGRYREIAAILC